jgi:hypothetical protein
MTTRAKMAMQTMNRIIMLAWVRAGALNATIYDMASVILESNGHTSWFSSQRETTTVWKRAIISASQEIGPGREIFFVISSKSGKE